MGRRSLRRCVLVTRLSPPECAMRLTGVCAPDPVLRLPFEARPPPPDPALPVRGSATPAGFSLRKSIVYRNSWQTYARGRFVPMVDGTRIEVTFGVHPFVKGFMAVWFGMAAFMGTLVLASMRGDAWLPLLFLLLLAGFGAGLVRFGRWLARDEEALLCEVLCTVLQATPPAAVPGDAIFRVAAWPPRGEIEGEEASRADEREQQRGARGG